MSSKHPDCIVPILPPKPEKKISDNADRVFCGALQLYLNKIGEHSVLQGDNDFQRFLEGEPVSSRLSHPPTLMNVGLSSDIWNSYLWAVSFSCRSCL